MKNKITAVEWLSNQAYELFEQYSEGKFDRIQLNKFMVEATNQAKAREKAQRINDINFGHGIASNVNINYEAFFKLEGGKNG